MCIQSLLRLGKTSINAQSSACDRIALGGSFGCPPLALLPSVMAAARGMPPNLPMRPGASGALSFELPLPIYRHNNFEICLGVPCEAAALCHNRLAHLMKAVLLLDSRACRWRASLPIAAAKQS